ncbi:LAFA_0E17832g1_1 [Lachancea sp. 'fantastica']|nr:LAFA_0E17832g1_1 [Lachancea sp. 'fantastica']
MGLEGNVSSSSATLELLSKYDNHVSERDEKLPKFERENSASIPSGSLEGPGELSYDELLKENVKLRLQLQEYETEMVSLKKFVEMLKSDRSAQLETVRQQLVVEERGIEDGAAAKKDSQPALPPRSADRKRNAKNLSLNSVSDPTIPDLRFRNLLSPADVGLKRTGPHNDSTPILRQHEDNEHVLSPSELDRIRRSSSSYSNFAAASPATSVAYTTSRISPSKSNKNFAAKEDESTINMSDKSGSSRQNTKGAAASIHESFTSPLRQVSNSSSHHNLTDNSARKAYPKSPVPNLLATEGNPGEFSPSSKRNLNNFADMLDSTFESQGPSSPQRGLAIQQDGSRALGSPVALKKPVASPVSGQSLMSSTKLQNPANEERPLISTMASSTGSYSFSTEDQQSPRSFSTKSHPRTENEGTFGTDQIAQVTSTPSAADARSIVSDIPLFLQPNELNGIRIEILSTLYRDQERFHDDNSILFSVIDKKSAKEIFRFAKTIDRVYELDVYLKCHMDTIMLPPLPEKQFFDSCSPVKVDYRRDKLNDYFSCLYNSTNLSPLIALKMAKFISTDTVISSFIGGYTKEGVLLMRKSKALGTPNTWRLTYGVLNNGTLSLLDHGQVTENIKLNYAVIELQANLPDDRYGTKNGFIVIVPKKSGLSSGTKYYFCCESPKERESWISTLTEFVESSVMSNTSTYAKSESSSMLDHTSLGDAVSDSTPSYIGPMANLQPAVKTPAAFNADTIPTEDDKESKRSRMRSFFPFKKVNVSQMPDSDLTAEGNQAQPVPGLDELSIAKTLQSMNLANVVSTDKVFGSDLDHCLSLSSQLYQGRFKIPSLVYRCLEYLYRNRGLEEEGIFRISGSTVLIKSLQEQFDKEYDVDLCSFNENVVTEEIQKNSYSTGLVDVNTVTGLLKLYLRQMPHSIFGDDMFIAFKNVIDSEKNASQVALKFRQLVNLDEMPFENLSLMYVLFELLVKINQKSSINKMNLRNLCIVFSPTLNIPVNVIQPFVVDFGCIFENEEPVSDSLREQLTLSIPHM